MSFITTKFHEILFNSSIFNFGQIFKLKKGVIPREKI